MHAPGFAPKLTTSGIIQKEIRNLIFTNGLDEEREAINLILREALAKFSKLPYPEIVTYEELMDRHIKEFADKILILENGSLKEKLKKLEGK